MEYERKRVVKRQFHFYFVLSCTARRIELLLTEMGRAVGIVDLGDKSRSSVWTMLNLR